MPILKSNSSSTGTIAYFADMPAIGFLPCDGSLLLRSAYASLFAVIGTTYNIGVPAETALNFRVPDLRGKSVLGSLKDLYRSFSNRAIGLYGGSEFHPLVPGELALHQHSATTSSQNTTHSHPVLLSSTSTNTSSQPLDNHYHLYVTSGQTANDGDRGGGKLCPEDERNGWDVLLESSASRVGGVANNLDHSHTYSLGGPSIQHDHTFTTDNGAVGGSGHNNIQPSLVAGFYIKY